MSRTDTGQPEMQADQHGTLGRGVRAVFSVTLLSRIAGLVREVLIARAFGASMVGSAFTFAFAVPNLFRRLLGEGALSAAFTPEYAQLTKHTPPAAHLLASTTLRRLAILTGVLALVACAVLLFILWVVPISPSRTLTLQLMAAMIFFMPPVCCAAILSAMLFVHGRFAAAASGPIVLNTFLVAVGLWYLLRNEQAGGQTAFVLAVATVLSGLTQCATFIWLLSPFVRWVSAADVPPEAAGAAAMAGGRMLTKFLAVVIGVGTLQLNTLVDQLIAMWPNLVGPTIFGVAYPLDASSNILIANAQRLYQFPLGVFGIAVASAVFPLLSLCADEPAKFADTLRRGARMSLFLGIPASIGLCVVRFDLAFVLYGGEGARGYSAVEVGRVGAVLFGYALAVWAFSLNHVLTRAFYAKGDTTTPMRIGVGMVVINLLLNLSLMWPLKEAGLAWATTIAAVLQSVVLTRRLRMLPGGHWLDAAVVRGVAKTTAAAAVMGGVCWALVWMWPIAEPGDGAGAPSWWSHAARLAATCAAGSAVFGGAAVALRLPEVGWILRPKRPVRASKGAMTSGPSLD